MSQESKYKLIYYGLAFLGVFGLGVLSPWLKSFGSAIYVVASIAYLITLVLVARYIALYFCKSSS